MKKVTYNECSFAEIFRFAEEKKLASWNECCDLFHRSEILNYKSPTDITLSEVLAYIEDDEEYYKKYKPAYQILADFMNEHDVKEMHVTGV